MPTGSTKTSEKLKRSSSEGWHILQNMIDSQSKSTMTVVQDVLPPWIPADAHVTTVVINHPPGAAGNPPHRLPSGPAFGYMIDGEMLFEIEGESPRVLRAGDAFWGPGGDVIHYQDANNRTDIPCSFVLTMLSAPGQPLLERVTDEELEERKGLRVTRTGAATSKTGHDSENTRAHQWREATRELVLTKATAAVAAEKPTSQGSISIALTGKALSSDLLLADSGDIALISLGENADARSHPMSVIPMRLDELSEPPVIRVLGRGVNEPTQLRLVVELTAHNPHTGTTSVMTCECDPVLLGTQMPHALLDFQPEQA
jgi:quercetin dioxygenase-like cupin family protein